MTDLRNLFRSAHRKARNLVGRESMSYRDAFRVALRSVWMAVKDAAARAAALASIPAVAGLVLTEMRAARVGGFVPTRPARWHYANANFGRGL